MSAGSRIYVDLDDVVCLTIELLLELLAREFGRRVPVEAVTCFDLAESFDLGPAELERFMARAHDPAVLLEYELRPGAAEALAAWRDQGHEVWIVTGRPAAAAAGTRQWLAAAGVPHDELLFVRKYRGRAYDTRGAEQSTPVEVLPELGFDLAVEDAAEMAVRLSEEAGVPVLLLDRPWNRDLTAAPGRIERCRDWDEIAARAAARLTPGRR